MDKLKKFIFVSSLLFLTTGLITACKKNPTPTPEPELELAPIDLAIDDSRGTATFEYTHVVDVDALKVSIDELFTVWIMIDEKDPKQETIIAGSGKGSQTSKLAGLNQGQYCWVTMNHQVEYDLSGVFKTSDCTFEIKVTGKRIKSEVTSNECPGSFEIDPTPFYTPPPEEVIKIPGNLLPVTWKPDTGVTITYTLSDVVVPESTGCQY